MAPGELGRKFLASAITAALKNFVADNNAKTSIVGVIAGAVLAVRGFDLAKLLSGDAVQIAHLVAGVLVACIGILATRRNADGKATLVGTMAGALYAAQGSVEAVTTGIVIAVLGYFTNKQDKEVGPALEGEKKNG